MKKLLLQFLVWALVYGVVILGPSWVFARWSQPAAKAVALLGLPASYMVFMAYREPIPTDKDLRKSLSPSQGSAQRKQPNSKKRTRPRAGAKWVGKGRQQSKGKHSEEVIGARAAPSRGGQ